MARFDRQPGRTGRAAIRRGAKQIAKIEIVRFHLILKPFPEHACVFVCVCASKLSLKKVLSLAGSRPSRGQSFPRAEPHS